MMTFGDVEFDFLAGKHLLGHVVDQKLVLPFPEEINPDPAETSFSA
jgi:hypothetical protein